MDALLAAMVVLSWGIAVFWSWCGLTAARYLPRLPNLLQADPQDAAGDPEGDPELTVVIPARDEAAAIEDCVRSLLAQSVPVAIIAVDDRSTDETGAILERLAREAEGKLLKVIRVESLPEGWLGKPYAMALAARQADTPWLLFTDADVIFRPEVLQRALRYVQRTNADHLVLMPTLILHTPGEKMIAGFLQVLSLLWWRPWRVADPGKKESIGIGAFNLIRSDVYRSVGGFEALRMDLLDDVRIGAEVKRAGYRQTIAFGPGMIRLHWASGALGMARNLTKNFFANFAFRPLALIGSCVWLGLLCFAPLAGLFGGWAVLAPSLISLAMIGLHYRCAARSFGVPHAVWALTMPVAAALVLWAMLRSMAVTLLRGGVEWRGTFYPLSELRRNARPVR